MKFSQSGTFLFFELGLNSVPGRPIYIYWQKKDITKSKALKSFYIAKSAGNLLFLQNYCKEISNLLQNYFTLITRLKLVEITTISL